VSASVKIMRELWAALALALHDRVTNPPACPECGRPHHKAATMRVASSFLRDNGYTAQSISERRQGLEGLAVLAQQFTADEEAS